VATNENQTSSFMPVAPQVGVGKVEEGVALTVVPGVTTPHSKFEFTVNNTAFKHSSFAGGGGGVPTQILKFAVTADVTFV
jgi:hypothetical protein